MAQEDGAVRIVTALDAEGFNKGVERMVKAMESLSGKIEKLGKTIETAFRGYLRVVQNAGAVTQGLGENVSGVTEQTQGLTGAVQGTAEAYKEVSKDAEAAKGAVSEFTDAANGGGELGAIREQIEALGEAYRNMLVTGGSTAQRGEFESAFDKAATELYDFQIALEKLSGTDDFDRLNEEAERLEQGLIELRDKYAEIDSRPVKVETDDTKVKEASKNLDETEKRATSAQNEVDKIGQSEDALQETESVLERIRNAFASAGAAAKNYISETAKMNSQYYTDFEKASETLENAKSRLSEITSSITSAEAALIKLEEKQDKMKAIGAKESSKSYKSLAYDIEEASKTLNGYRTELAHLISEVLNAQKITGKSNRAIGAYVGAVDSNNILNQLENLKKVDGTDTEWIRDIQVDWSQLVEGFGKTAQSADGAEESLKDVDRELKQKKTDAENAGRGVSFLSTMFKGLSETVSKAWRDLLKFASGAILSGIRQIGDAAAEAARGLTQMTARGLTSGIKRLSGWLSNAARSMLIFHKASRKNNDVLKRGFMTVLRYGLGIRSLYFLFNRLRAAIKEGFQNLARYSDETNKSLSAVLSSFTRLKNAIAGAFAPVVNTVGPALAQLINGMSNATSSLGIFMAALSGQKTFIRAKEVQQDYAESLNKTSKEAEKAKRQLAGFDDLNILSENKADEGLKPEDMFETVPVEGAAKDFAEAVRDAWENADFTDIGGVIGAKLNDALDAIPWGKFKKTASKVAKSLATLINGALATKGLFSNIGNTVAEAINTALGAVGDFTWTLKWDSLGGAIVDAVDGAISNLNWPAINRGLQGIASGIADMLNAVFDRETVWKEAGETLGKALNALVDAGITFLERFDFVKAARAIVAGLNAAVSEIEWDKIGRLFGDYFGGALQFLYTAAAGFNWIDLAIGFAEGLNTFASTLYEKIKGLDWRGVGVAIGDGFNTAVAEIHWDEVGQTVGALFGGALSAVASFIRDLDFGEIVSAIQDFFTNALKEIDFYDLITVWGVAALVIAVKKIIASHPVLSLIVGAVLALGPEFGPALSKMIEKIPWAEAGQKFSSALVSTLDRLKEALASVDWKGFGEKVGQFLGEINWQGVFDGIVEIIKIAIKAAIETIKGVIKGMGEEKIKEALGVVLNVVLAYIGLKVAAGAIKSALTGAVHGIGDAVGGAISSLAGPITAKIGSLIPAISTAAWGVVGALAIIYDVKTLSDAAKTYNEAQETHTRETENALNNFRKVYEEKGPEVAAEWAKMAYQIDTTGMSMEQAQKALAEKVDSYWDDVPQNMWDGFKQGWNYYFGENGAGIGRLVIDGIDGMVGAVKNFLGIASPSKVFSDIGENVVLGLENGLTDTWSNITTFFSGAFSALQTSFSDAWSAIKGGASTAWSGISTTLSGAWEGVKGAAKEKFSQVASDTSRTWNDLKTSLSKKASEIKTDVSAKIRELASSTKSLWTQTKTDASAAWDGLRSSVTSQALSAKNQILSAFQTLQSSLSGVWSGIKAAASGAMSSISGTVSSMVSSISSRVSSIQSTVSNITSSASTALTKVADKMDDLTKKAATNAFSGFSGAFASGGVILPWGSVRKYAAGTARAMGSLFLAGEAGPEIVGHVNGRTEVLNQSQIAGAIYSAVLAAMQTAINALSQQMANNTNALIAALTQIQIQTPTVSAESAALMERLSALSAVPYQVPAYATGTVMPYEVVAEIRRQTSELKTAIYDEGEQIIQAVVSAISNHGLALTDAIGNIQTGGEQSYSLDYVAQYTIDEINRRKRMTGKSPLLA